MALGEPRNYCLRALLCRQRAGIARDPKDKATWHELEKVWLDLALRVEADDKVRRTLTPLKPN